jgi:hypothetical protein
MVPRSSGGQRGLAPAEVVLQFVNETRQVGHAGGKAKQVEVRRSEQ